mgnify:CR=1 FL=1
MRWIGGLRDLLRVPRIGLLYLLGFLFMIMWYGGVTVITVFMLKILEARGADAAQEAYWVGAAAMEMMPEAASRSPWADRPSASSRVTATAMALGEAAGTAAALAMKAKSEVGTLDGVRVRETLAQQNAGPFSEI